MKNKAIQIIMFLVIAIFAMNTFAETWHTSYIKTIYPLSDGSFIVIPVTDSAQCSGTPGNQYFWVKAGFHGMTEKGLEKMYAALLGAHLANKRVSLVFDEADSYCPINRIQVLNN